MGSDSGGTVMAETGTKRVAGIRDLLVIDGQWRFFSTTVSTGKLWLVSTQATFCSKKSVQGCVYVFF